MNEPNRDCCMSCGTHKRFDLPEQILEASDGGLVEHEIKSCTHPQYRLGSITLCVWCRSGLISEASDRVMTEHVMPLTEKLNKIKEVMKEIDL